MTTRALVSLVLVWTSVSTVDAQPSTGEQGQISTLDAHLSRWRTRHGGEWRIEADPETGFIRMLYGGSTVPASAPREDADFLGLARLALEETGELHGLDLSTLSEERVQFLPLSQIGSSDKLTVRLRQAVGGVRVVDGWANVLFDTQGRLLSVQSTGLPRLAGFSTRPTLSAELARLRAAAQFLADEGLQPTQAGAPELVIDPTRVEKRREGRLAWQIDLQWRDAASFPVGYTYWVDALDGSVLRRARSVHEFDVSGTVSSLATPGVLPDTVANPETAQILRYARVQSAQGTLFTDANGNFNYPGVNAPLAVTFTYVGTFNNVLNSAGAEYTLTQTLVPNQANAVLLNPAPTDAVTAQANTFVHINRLRDWIRSINPTDATADFVATANVNLAQTCNAFFDGSSVNFYAAGGSCPNTAYSTVVAHEMGHWFNVLYGTGNGGDGMGEGNADVFAMYLYDNPIVGENFCGAGCHVRNGNNNRQFCGDCCPACYGGVHADGEPWMGAAWKIRTRLDNTHGNAAGDAIADSLFLGWMNAYDQSQIRSVIETQWLTLDDNDGNIDNGTPHYTDIDQGFRDQGFPGFDLPAISILGVTDLPDTSNEAGPYAVAATIVAQVAPPILSATLRYRRNGGAFVALAMSPTGGNGWSASIPGQAGGSRVDYYVSATDSAANSATFPSGAPGQTLSFAIGVLTGFFSDTFETAGDNGWTHASVGDTSNLQDDWQRGAPAGRSGTSFGVPWSDPAAAASPTRCWGNDLGNGTFNGSYAANVHNYLRSPAIDFSGKWGTRLRFKRWLTVEEGIYDQARILVNGSQVWVNPDNGHVQDASWSTREVEIGALADNNASVRIEFRLKSDGGLELGGWQLDDVEVLYHAPGNDMDGDGVPDGSDNCPTVPNANQANADGDAFGDACDTCTDTDGDGFGNPGFPANTCPPDGCPNDPLKSAPGQCGCGVPDTDSDGDGTANCNDGCPNDPLKIAPGICGCGVPDTDSDGDGTANCNDGCPNDPLKIAPGICGCGVPDTDSDGDGLADCIDNCDAIANPGQEDCDTDGVGDACEIAQGAPDCNGNAVPDECDISSGSSADQNGNGVPDECEGTTGSQTCLPGTGGVIPCPCVNPPAGGGGGCDNFGAGPAQSGTLDASGTASLGADTVVLQATGENDFSLTVFWTGKDPLHPTGLPHGAGVRCVTDTLRRLYTGSASGAAIARPGAGDPSVSARTAAVGSPIFAGEQRHYFTIYRDPNAAGPCGNTSSTINLTNAYSIVWAP